MSDLFKDKVLLISICTSLGFVAGLLGASLLSSSNKRITSKPKTSTSSELKPMHDDSTECDTDSDLDEEQENKEPCKLVLIVRTDLGMTKGKVAAQCSHATLACYKRALREHSPHLDTWEYLGQAKITLKCNSEEEMLALQGEAQKAGLVCKSIQDAGRTQISPGSRTVLGIGPAPVSRIDKVAGHLKLY